MGIMGADHIIGNFDEIEDETPEISNINIDNDINEWSKIISDEVCQLISEESERKISTDIQNPKINWPIEKIINSINKLLDFDYLKAKYLIKDQKENAFARKASMTMVEYNRNAIKALKTQWFLSINTEKWELLWKLFNGFTTQKGNIVDHVLTKEDIKNTIKSYYRKKALQSFEKITKFIGVNGVLRKSYNTDDSAKSLFYEIEQDMLFINWEELDNEYLISKEELWDLYLDAFRSLSEEEITFLAIGYREVAISFNFNATIDHIKMTFDNILSVLNNTTHTNRNTLKDAIKKQLKELES